MSNIRVQNVNGAKPQHIRDDNSASIIANNIASRVSVSNRETVTALAQIQQSGFAGLMSNIDSKNIKLVDLILGRVASLLDEEFAKLNQQDLAKLKADLVSQAANISATQMTKADKVELQASLTAYFDKKINMKQLELQLADLNVTVHGLQKQLNTASGTTSVSSPSTSYAGTISAVNSAMKSFSAQFAMVPMQLDAVLKNQQLILNSVSGMYSSINKIYAIVDAIDTKQTWEMLKPFVEPLYKKMYNYLFGLFGAKPPFEQSDKDDKTIVAQIGDRIDFAAKQVVYAINTQFEFLANKKFYKYVPYSTVNLREPTQFESTWALVKSWFSSKNYEDILKEIMFDPNSEALQTYEKEKQERKELNELLKKHFDNASGPEAFFSNTTEQIAAKKKEQAVAEAAKRTQSFQERVESWLHGVDKILGVFKKDVVDDGKKERSVWDTIKNFFKGIANIVDWAANGADSPTAPNMWKHFGLGGLPEIVDKVNKILNGEFKFEGNNFLSGLGSILNSENFKEMLSLLKDKQSLGMLQNIAASAASVFNSDAMKLFASVYATNQDKNNTNKNESLLDKATGWLKTNFFNKLVILRDKLIPLFGSEAGQYDVTKTLINNFIDLSKKLPELFGIVDSVDRLWTKIINTDIYKQFNNLDSSDNKNTKKASEDDILNSIVKWTDSISSILDKLHSADVINKAKILIDKLGTIEFSKLESLLMSTDKLFNMLKESSLMDMFSSNGVAAENTSTIEQSKSKIEEKTKEIISYISAADTILKAVNESSLVKSINTIIKSFSEDDVASSIDKAVSPISAVLGIYSKLKAAFFDSTSLSPSKPIDGNKIAKDVKEAAKVLDAVVENNIAQKIANIAKSVESANIAGILGSTDDPDSLFGKLMCTITSAGKLKKAISEQFGSYKKEEENNYNLVSFSKDLSDAMLIIEKIDYVVNFINKNNTLDKAAAEIGKIDTIFNTISRVINSISQLFGGQGQNKSNGSLSKTLDSATNLVYGVDNILNTMQSFKLSTGFVKAIKYAEKTFDSVFEKASKLIDDKIDNLVLNLIAVVNSLVFKVNEAIPLIKIGTITENDYVDAVKSFKSSSAPVFDLTIPQQTPVVEQVPEVNSTEDLKIDEDNINEETQLQVAKIIQMLGNIESKLPAISRDNDKLNMMNTSLNIIKNNIDVLLVQSSKEESLAMKINN